MTIADKKKLFNQWAYGLFIHYGVYSTFGLGEWLMFLERRKPEEYFREGLPKFKPRRGCAREWVELAKRGGMKYAVLTTRHHEGYFIGEELLHEFVDACRENGLGVGFYYSVADWSDPGYCAGPASPDTWKKFVEKAHRQIREIMTGYGKIDYLFYDGCPPPASWGLHELHKEIRALQPEMLISRCREDVDLKSCEGHANGDPDNLWESCYTLNDSWGYNRFDHNWKPVKKVISMLSNNRHNGGNLLLNVGPMADGTVQREAVEIIEKVGTWLRENGEAIYDVIPHPFDYHDREYSTAKGSTAYIRLENEYRGPQRRLCGIANQVKKISILSTGEEIAFQQQDDVITLTGLIPQEENALQRVLKLELDGAPKGIRNPMSPDYAIKFTGE